MENEQYTLLITMPKNAVYDENGRWQPTKITAREGWKEITWWMRIIYIVFVCWMVCYNIHHLFLLSEDLLLPTWFGMGAVSVSPILYMVVSIALLLYFIYRDLIRRSISRYRLFVPLAVIVMNSCFVEACPIG